MVDRKIPLWQIVLGSLIGITGSVAVFGLSLSSLIVSEDYISSHHSVWAWTFVEMISSLILLYPQIVLTIRGNPSNPTTSFKVIKPFLFGLIFALSLWGIYIYVGLGFHNHTYPRYTFIVFQVLLWTNMALLGLKVLISEIKHMVETDEAYMYESFDTVFVSKDRLFYCL